MEMISHSKPAESLTPSTEAMVEHGIEELIDSESVPELDDKDAEKEPPTYDEAFPPLAGSSVGGMAGAPHRSFAEASAARPALKTSTITCLFSIPAIELKSSNHSMTVKSVSEQTGTQIEITTSRDGSVTVMVSGKHTAVNKAKIKLQKELQTNAQATIHIPKEHHKNIIGKSRKTLLDIEARTSTEIKIPPPSKNDDTITIIGSKEGIEKAMHRIKVISDEQFSKYKESVTLPRIYFPWIGRARSTTLQKLEKDTGCRINVPPLKSDSEEIIVMGEKDKVTAAIKLLENKCKLMEENFSNIQVEIRQSQHKYIERYSGVQDIFDQTGIWVEIPQDGSATIKLFGPEDQLSSALSLLFEKANSIKTCDIACPAWLMKYVIGKNGENIRSLSEEFKKTVINCQSEKNTITIDAPNEEFNTAKEKVTELVSELKNTRDRALVKIDSKIHKHLIGKSGSNINKIRNETGVSIKIPQDTDEDVEIIGPPDGVKKAKAMLIEQAKRIENEANVELVIDQKWHRLLIGQKGENIQKIRVQFPEVQVSFPSAGTKKPECDKVQIRGPRKDVDAVTAMIKKQVNVIIDENYTMKVPILKHHHRYIIGKGGINIKKVKEETDTRIDLPSEDAESDLIIITGKKANVDAARKKLLAIQAELEGIYEEQVKIDPKLHNTIIGAKGRIIRNLIEESGSVQIRFPSADNPSEKVSIRGEKVDVLKAKEKLLSLAHEKELESYHVEVSAKSDFHRFLIGKKGANVQKLKKEFGVNYVFPRADDKDDDIIMITGRKEAVEKAAKNLRETVKELENTSEVEIEIEAEYFKKVTNRSTIDQMTSELGGIKVVPRPSSSTIKIAGPKTCVEEAKTKIAAMIEEFRAQVEISVEILRQYHRDIIGPGGHNVRAVTLKHSVQISLPPAQKRDTPNGHVEDSPEQLEALPVTEGPDPQDLIKIVGRPENCEAAKADLLELIPISKNMEIPFEYHRFIIGKAGESIKKLMDEFDCNVQVPGTAMKSNTVVIRGHKDKVAECQEHLLTLLEQWDREKEDRLLKSYQLNLTVDHRHHSKIIGRRGAVIKDIKDEHDVMIRMPDKNGTGDRDIITITGYQTNAEAARDAIMKIVSELEERVSDTVEIDSRVHARLIGQRGKNIRKIMDKFGVDIKFTGGETGNTVTIEGNEENVEDCKDHLIELADEYMDAILEKLEFQAEMSQYTRPEPQRGFFVRNAPWQQAPPPQVAPDTSDMAAFPDLGSNSVAPQSSAGSWGSNKRWR